MCLGEFNGESVIVKKSLKGLFADICCVLGQNTPPIPFHRNVRRTIAQKLEQQISYYDMTKCGCILYIHIYIYTYIYNIYTKHIHFCCFGCGWFMGRLPTQNMPGQKDHGVLLEYLVPARLDMANARDIPRTYPLTLLFNRCTWRWGPAKVSWSVQQALIFAIIIFRFFLPAKARWLSLGSSLFPSFHTIVKQCDSFLRGFNMWLLFERVQSGVSSISTIGYIYRNDWCQNQLHWLNMCDTAIHSRLLSASRTIIRCNTLIAKHMWFLFIDQDVTGTWTCDHILYVHTSA